MYPLSDQQLQNIILLNSVISIHTACYQRAGMSHAICFFFFFNLQRCLCINSIAKIMAQFCYFETTFRYWNCFLSSVSTDGKDGYGLKLEKNGQLFKFWCYAGKTLLWLVLPDKIFKKNIFFITLQEHFVCTK